MSGKNDSLNEFPYAPGYAYDTEGFTKVATAPPLPNITRAHLPKGYDDYNPPLLHFGWTIDSHALVRWGAENGIDTTERCQESANSPIVEEPNSLSTVVTREVMRLLAEKAGTPNLRPAFRMCVRMDGNFIIAISSNYRFLKDRKTITQERIDTLDRYLKEQGIVQDSPGWHLDYEHHRWRPL